MNDVVVPKLREFNEKRRVELVGECRKAGLSYEEYKTKLKDAVSGFI